MTAYTPDVTPAEHKEYMASVDARERRQAAIVGEIPVFIGRVLRGRMREDVAPLVAPTPLPHDMLYSFGKRFAHDGVVHLDQFTKSIPTFRTREDYQRYVLGAGRRNQRIQNDPDNRAQAVAAKQRQAMHVADKVNKQVWTQRELAGVFGAALHHTRLSVAHRTTPDETALRFSASAIEDLGFSLEESMAARRIKDGGRFARSLQQIGQYAAAQPESLLVHDPLLFLVAEREQERRADHWGNLLAQYERPDWGGMRRTETQFADEAANQALIAGFQVE
jgi:hypothetical protein